MNPRGVIVAGTGSGSGKTLATMTLLSGLAQRNYPVHPFKCGPDFIDPRHHEWIAGVPSGNLDLHFSDPTSLRERYDRMVEGSSGGVVEGVMGLYDGLLRGTSTYDVARILELPIVLVISAQGMAETVAAVVKGVLSLRPGLHLLGIIATRTGSDRHRSLIAEALNSESLPPLLGVLPRDETLSLPERYLGLSLPGEKGEEESWSLREALSKASKNLDWITLLTAFSPPIPFEPKETEGSEPNHDFFYATRKMMKSFSEPSGKKVNRRPIRLGVALDEAFWFYYPENWEIFSRVGIQVEFFSPLRDTSLPGYWDGLYLGGGYPERFAKDLSENRAMVSDMRAFCESGRPVYAECGGMLYLTDGPQVSPDGAGNPLVGVLPFHYVLGDRLKRLGYAEVKPESGFFTRSEGPIRGHLFHYSRLENHESTHLPAFRHTSDHRPEGFVNKGVIASYLHLYFPSNPTWADALAKSLENLR